jgi:hypothetical protein
MSELLWDHIDTTSRGDARVIVLAIRRRRS